MSLSLQATLAAEVHLAGQLLLEEQTQNKEKSQYIKLELEGQEFPKEKDRI